MAVRCACHIWHTCDKRAEDKFDFTRRVGKTWVSGFRRGFVGFDRYASRVTKCDKCAGDKCDKSVTKAHRTKSFLE